MGQYKGHGGDGRAGSPSTVRKLLGASLIMGASMLALLFNNAILAPKATTVRAKAGTYEPNEAESLALVSSHKLAKGEGRIRGSPSAGEPPQHRCTTRPYK